MLLPLGVPPGNSRIPIGNGRVGPGAPRLEAERPRALAACSRWLEKGRDRSPLRVPQDPAAPSSSLRWPPCVSRPRSGSSAPLQPVPLCPLQRSRRKGPCSHRAPRASPQKPRAQIPEPRRTTGRTGSALEAPGQAGGARPGALGTGGGAAALSPAPWCALWHPKATPSSGSSA